jgi:anti-sigma factor RsiW
LNSNGLSCQELVELVTEYLEDTMPPEERLRFEAHLSGCRPCQAYLEQMRQTIRSMGALSEEAVPPETREELLAAFRDWRSR